MSDNRFRPQIFVELGKGIHYLFSFCMNYHIIFIIKFLCLLACSDQIVVNLKFLSPLLIQQYLFLTHHLRFNCFRKSHAMIVHTPKSNFLPIRWIVDAILSFQRGNIILEDRGSIFWPSTIPTGKNNLNEAMIFRKRLEQSTLSRICMPHKSHILGCLRIVQKFWNLNNWNEYPFGLWYWNLSFL